MLINKVLGLTKGHMLSMVIFALLAAQPSAMGQIVVNTVADTGPGSLREAIAISTDGDVIAFDATFSGQTIHLLSTLTVAKNITILGPGPEHLSISGSPAISYQLMEITADSFQASGLTFRDVYYEYGGAVLSATNSVVILENCVIRDITGGVGSAISLHTPRENQSRFINCRFSNCQSDAVGGVMHVSCSYLYRPDNFKFENCTFDNNSSPTQGGAIYTYKCGLALQNCTFFNNHAVNTGGAISLGNGGVLAMEQCTFHANSAAKGGAVYSAAGTITMGGSILTGNTSPDGSSDVPHEDFATVVSTGYNVIGGVPGGVLSATDIVGTVANPIDGGLGTTLVEVSPSRAVLPITCASPAFDAGDPLSSSSDALGQAVFGTQRDIGAHEIQVDCHNLCPYAEAPSNLSHAIAGDGTVTLNWTPLQQSFACQVSGAATGSPLIATPAVIGADIASYEVPSIYLDPGVQYDWKVRCACSDVYPYDLTNYSEIDQFTTASTRLSQRLPLIRIYPSTGSQGTRTIVFEKNCGAGVIRIYSLAGALMKEIQIQEGMEGDRYPLNTDAWPVGTYVLNATFIDVQVSEQFVIGW